MVELNIKKNNKNSIRLPVKPSIKNVYLLNSTIYKLPWVILGLLRNFPKVKYTNPISNFYFIHKIKMQIEQQLTTTLLVKHFFSYRVWVYGTVSIYSLDNTGV